MTDQPQVVLKESYGSVRGRLLSVGTRGAPVAIVEDHLSQLPVVCFLREGDAAELSDDVVGRNVIIEGTVSRDPDTWRMVSVHAVRSVTVLPPPDPHIWRKTRGILKPPADGSLPEERIRRMRDDV